MEKWCGVANYQTTQIQSVITGCGLQSGAMCPMAIKVPRNFYFLLLLVLVLLSNIFSIFHIIPNAVPSSSSPFFLTIRSSSPLWVRRQFRGAFMPECPCPCPMPHAPNTNTNTNANGERKAVRSVKYLDVSSRFAVMTAPHSHHQLQCCSPFWVANFKLNSSKKQRDVTSSTARKHEYATQIDQCYTDMCLKCISRSQLLIKLSYFITRLCPFFSNRKAIMFPLHMHIHFPLSQWFMHIGKNNKMHKNIMNYKR